MTKPNKTKLTWFSRLLEIDIEAYSLKKTTVSEACMHVRIAE